MSKKKIGFAQARALVDAAMELHGRQLWRKFKNEDVLVVEIPGQDDPLWISIMGAGGQEYGLNIFRGESAAIHMQSMLEAHGSFDPEAADMMGLSIDPREEIPRELRGVLQAARFFERLSPAFFVKGPHSHLRPPSLADLRIFTYAIKGILEAHDRGLLRPASMIEGGPLLKLRVSGQPLHPSVQAEALPVARGGEDRLVAMGSLPAEMRAIRRGFRAVVVDCPIVPGQIRGSEGKLRALIAMDARSEEVLGTEIAVGTPIEELGGSFLALFRKSVGELPRRLVFASAPLYSSFHQAFEGLGVDCTLDPDCEAMREFVASLVDHMLDPPEESEEEPPEDPAELTEWKRVELSLIERLATRFMRERRFNERSLKRYFGSTEWFEGHPDKEDIAPVFVEWGVTCYRPTKRSKTIAEMLLAAELPRAEREILESRLAASTTLFRIDEIDDEGRVVLHDLLGDREVAIQDRSMALTARVDLCLVGRAFPVGEFHFFAPLSPPFPMWAFGDALAVLEKHGAAVTETGLEGKLDAIGSLWRWREEQLARGPVTLANTEGDPLLECKATFALADVPEFVQLLESNDDLVEDREDGTWIWEQETGSMPPVVLMARLQIIGDTLLVETNSESRMQRVRDWIESIPGVTLTRVTVEPVLPEKPRELPLDDRLPSTPDIDPTELSGALQEMLEEYIMASLDQAVPEFGGRTPREMVSVERGAEQVRRWIDSYPRPDSPHGPLEVPRERMKRELGLSP